MISAKRKLSPQHLELVKETEEALAEGKLRSEDEDVSDKVGELDGDGYDRYYYSTADIVVDELCLSHCTWTLSFFYNPIVARGASPRVIPKPQN
jgi:hypothetical protein